MREKSYLFALNGGEVSPLALGRVDLSRMRISAEQQLNCIPRVIGPMQARPGFGYIGSTAGDAEARMIPFVFSATDTAMIECSDGQMRVLINGELMERPSVSTTITNGTFDSSSGWTLSTTGTGVALVTGGLLILSTPGRGDTTLCRRSVTVSPSDQNVEHAVEIKVIRGPVRFRCGSTSGGQEYINETELATGLHSIAFTPAGGTFYVQFSCESEAQRAVDYISIAASGTFAMPAPWTAGNLPRLRYDQSGDVIFITSSAGDMKPHRIERRAARSWSITDYDFSDGPFRGQTANITLTPSALNGNGTLTASAPFFELGHVGSPFRLTHNRTVCTSVLTGDDRYTDDIRVSGNSRYDTDSDGSDENTAERDVTITITGTWVGSISLLISDDDGASWRVVEEFTSNQAGVLRTPGAANTVVLVRAGFLAGAYTSGAATVTLSYAGGGGDGYVRITSVSSSTSAGYEVITRLHQAAASAEWSEGQFSAIRGYPTAIALFEGRLWWGGADKVYGSVSDGFNSFDLNEEGDSGPIIRSIATGAVNAVRWILGLARLCIGTSGAEPVGRSSSFDEPMTPSNFSIKDASTQGSADIQAVKVDRSGIFVQRSGKRAYDLSYSIDSQDYTSQEITRYHPTILDAGVVRIAVQRQPDTRVWFVLTDGTLAGLTYERGEDVISWFRVDTDGAIEDIAVLPNVDDDDVYIIARRTIGGVTKRYIERLAYDHQAHGGASNYMADAYVVRTLVSSDSVTGLSHLEGKSVVAWADGSAVMDGDDPRTFTVSGGVITLPSAVAGDVVVGLPYEWRWKSAKLAYGAQDGAPLSRRRNIKDLAMILYKAHIRGVRFGQDFDKTDPLPTSYRGSTLTTNEMLDAYDEQAVPMPGQWDTDCRLCLKGQAPLPCTVLGLSLTMESH